MAYCPNCGDQVEEVHHYCGSCGQALSKVAESEDESPLMVVRDGFLSSRSIAYITGLINGDRTLDRDSASHKQLQRDVRAVFADMTLLAMVEDLNLLFLWASGLDSHTADDVSLQDMNNQQIQDWLAARGLSSTLSTLQLYDDAFGTSFEDEVEERFQKLVELANEEIDDD